MTKKQKTNLSTSDFQDLENLMKAKFKSIIFDYDETRGMPTTYCKPYFYEVCRTYLGDKFGMKSNLIKHMAKVHKAIEEEERRTHAKLGLKDMPRLEELTGLSPAIIQKVFDADSRSIISSDDIGNYDIEMDSPLETILDKEREERIVYMIEVEAGLTDIEKEIIKRRLGIWNRTFKTEHYSVISNEIKEKYGDKELSSSMIRNRANQAYKKILNTKTARELWPLSFQEKENRQNSVRSREVVHHDVHSEMMNQLLSGMC